MLINKFQKLNLKLCKKLKIIHKIKWKKKNNLLNNNKLKILKLIRPLNNNYNKK